jgi:glycosyltransferase involved in cell wall biosynthesis
MASGLPIACSDRGPMPEVLKDGGVYFDPEDPTSIESAIRSLLTDPGLRKRVMARAKQLSDEYSWGRCSAETWRFLAGNAAQFGTKRSGTGKIPVTREAGYRNEK